MKSELKDICLDDIIKKTYENWDPEFGGSGDVRDEPATYQINEVCFIWDRGKHLSDRIDESTNLSLCRMAAWAAMYDIALYCNGKWIPNWNDSTMKYKIINRNGEYHVGYDVKSDGGNIYFKDLEDAQAVIDNPDLRYVLDIYFRISEKKKNNETKENLSQSQDH